MSWILTKGKMSLDYDQGPDNFTSVELFVHVIFCRV